MKQIRCIRILPLILLAVLSTSAYGQHKTIAVIITAGHFKDRTVPSFMPNGKQVDADYIKAGITTYFQRLPKNQALKSANKKWRFDKLIELTTEPDTPPDRLATRQNIIEALNEVRRVARPGDAVIFYFSGHGGRRGADFSLCPFDADRESDRADIQDKELGDWVRNLTTDNVTLILDCCFNEYPPSKGIQPQKKPKFVARDLGVALAQLNTVFPPDKAVVLTASRQDEEAQEYEKSSGLWVGVYTDQLVQDLQASSPDMTYKALAMRTRDNLQRYVKVRFEGSFSQTPEVLGSDEQKSRRLFRAPDRLAGAPPAIPAALIPPYITVAKARKGQVDLNAGSDQSVSVGSEYNIYPAKKLDFTKPVGKVRITDVAKDSAIANVISVISGSGIRDKDLAVETLHQEPAAQKSGYRVRVDAPESMKAEIERAFRTQLQVQIVQDRPVLILEAAGQSGELTGKLYRSDGKHKYGDPVQQVNVTDASGIADAIRPRIGNLAALRTLATLNNPNPGISLQVSTPNTIHPFGDKFNIFIDALDPQGDRVDCYITVIDIDANGTPAVIFPKLADPELRDNHLRRDRSGPYTLPVRVFAPAGEDTVIVIATRQPVQSLEALASRQAAGENSALSKGLDSVGGEIQHKPLNDWAKAMLTVVIVDPSPPDTLPAHKVTGKTRAGGRGNDKE